MASSAGPASVLLGGYLVHVDTAAPQAIDHHRRRAELAHALAGGGEHYAFVAVAAPGEEHSSLVVEGTFTAGGGRGPGLLVVPETQQVFLGTGTTLTAFDRRSGRWRRTWTDEAQLGFWGWSQHGDVVLMAAELELAAWTTDGAKLWSRLVEPPWTYAVTGQEIRLDVMGSVSRLPLRGPA